MKSKAKSQGLIKRVKTMLKVDMRRMFISPLVYILIGSCFVMPILILVMTTMMAGTVPTDPQTGLPGEPIEAFENVWQIIGSVSSESMMGGGAAEGGADAMAAGMDMSITAMCNINMLYFIIAVLVCLFVSDDFRSGYAKNLFTVRARKTDYVISKTLTCFVGGALMILAFFVGALIGGAVSGVSFDMVGFNAGELVMCVITKVLLVSVFVPIYLIMSVAAKQKAWLSMLLSFGVGMFLFMMIPMMSPLNASIIHVVLCIAGGAMFSVGLGAISNHVLKKTSLV
ncbi:MAG: hypothetical protein E7649_05350 [Ruminococcaceae bacterium]|nr:hypothetical protein [Oscillospiraceae bacterium]